MMSTVDTSLVTINIPIDEEIAMKLANLFESKLYKFHSIDDEGGVKAFVTSSTDLKMTTPTMIKRVERTGKNVEVSLDGKVIGKITKTGLQLQESNTRQLEEGKNLPKFDKAKYKRAIKDLAVQLTILAKEDDGGIDLADEYLGAAIQEIQKEYAKFFD